MKKISEITKSIKFRLFSELCISTCLLIFLIIIINSLVVGEAEKIHKINEARKLGEMITNYYNSSQNIDFQNELKQYEITKNYQFLIKNRITNEVLYSTNKFMEKTVFQIENDKAQYNFDETKSGVTYNINDEKFNLIKLNLGDDYIVYIKISMNQINEYVKTSNITLLIIGLFMILLSSIIASFISEKYTEPIIQMTRITSKMANLDFSEKYRIKDNDNELNILGKNINKMSDTLESKIESLRKSNNSLENDILEKSKLDEMRNKFVSDVSHELKTPIALIEGYSEGLMENINSDEESRKFYAEVINDEAKKMEKIVKELLELMKLEYSGRKFKNERFCITDMIQKELKMETLLFEENHIKIEFDDSKKIYVFSDEKYIGQVFTNYLSNAIKNCEERNNEKKIQIRFEHLEDKLRVFVYNTGKNIPEEKIDKIWNRFYKADESRDREKGGTGIGLALVKAIMDNYGSEYGVTNYDNGVEFYFDVDLKEKSKPKKENKNIDDKK